MRSCQSQLLAEMVGNPIPIDEHHAAKTRDQVGAHTIGWFHFQPLYHRIVREHPDFLD